MPQYKTITHWKAHHVAVRGFKHTRTQFSSQSKFKSITGFSSKPLLIGWYVLHVVADFGMRWDGVGLNSTDCYCSICLQHLNSSTTPIIHIHTQPLGIHSETCDSDSVQPIPFLQQMKCNLNLNEMKISNATMDTDISIGAAVQ